jgi:hypothetical protein
MSVPVLAQPRPSLATRTGRGEDGFGAPLGLRRRDTVAIGVLVGVPLLLLSLPAAAGYPLMTGDAVIQNYPLRVLAGEVIAHGHLPQLDPFDFAGTPLLGGINAGAAFPDVVLFGLLPHVAAWVASCVIAYAAAGCGLYLFLRGNTLGLLPSFLGASTYGLGGFLCAQAVHLDVVEVGAALAWALLGLERLAHGPPHQRPGWAAVLGVASGCVALAGSPEAAFDATLAAAIYAVHLAWRERHPLRFAAFALAGAVTGLLLGGVQIATGAGFVLASQRAHVGLSFLSAGTVDRGLVFLLAPHLLGGGPLGLEPYVGSYNLGELDAYTGIVALCATFFLAVAPARAGSSRWRVWLVVAVAGLAIATSGDTGLVHLLAQLPVIGASRLLSRALLLWSLATAVLLAYFAAELVAPGSVAAEPGCGRWSRRRDGRRGAGRVDRTGGGGAWARGGGAWAGGGGAWARGGGAWAGGGGAWARGGGAWARGGGAWAGGGVDAGGGARDGAGAEPPWRLATWTGLVPMLMVLALLATVAIGGRGAATALAGQGVGPWSVAAVAPYLAAAGAVAVGAGALLLGARRRGVRSRRLMLAAIVLVDLALSAVNQSSFAPVRAREIDPAASLGAQLRARLGPSGRFLVVDPQRAGGAQLDELGAPDLNVLDGAGSAQGYGSLVWGPYQAATGTHGQDVVAPDALAGSTFDELGVRLLLAVPSDFTVAAGSPRVAGGGAAGAGAGPDGAGAGPDGAGEGPDGQGDATAAGSWAVPPDVTTSRLFGGVERVAELRLALTADPHRGISTASLATRARLLGVRGEVLHLPLRARWRGDVLELAPARPVLSSGVLVEPAAGPAGHAVLTLHASVAVSGGDDGGARLLDLDGPLASDVTLPHWRPAGQLGPYELIADTRAVAGYRLQTPAVGTGRPRSRIVADSESPWTGDSVVTVDAAAPVRLVRDVADIPGWRAVLRTGGSVRNLALRRDGLVQAVLLPRGRDEVTFTYTAPGLAAGMAATGAGIAALVTLTAWAWRRWQVRRRRREVADVWGRV